VASRSLIVLPDDTARTILAAIENATRSIRVKMFVFTDPGLLSATIAAKQRGIDVRIMLNPSRRDGEDDNAHAREVLAAGGVDVHDSNPAFALTHEKSMVVDDEVAFVKSLNWETKNLTETRDYAIVTDHQAEVAEIVACFEADWDRRPFDPCPDARLVWCPFNGRERISRFIDNAKHRIIVENERYQDAIIIERLVRAKTRGVTVHVLAKPPHTLKHDKLIEGVGGLRIMDDVGIKVRKLHHLKLHGKMFLADDNAAIVGSINLAPGSLDGRRELAIEVRDEDVVDRLHAVAMHDWKHSHELDLSDEGLLADLQDRRDAIEALGLNADHHERDDGDAA
jgi:phosphatidylserine/phosphatidylglycerophosphate/cardiolipin synthase-like enzyme